jgi:hypothetical protein
VNVSTPLSWLCSLVLVKGVRYSIRRWSGTLCSKLLKCGTLLTQEAQACHSVAWYAGGCAPQFGGCPSLSALQGVQLTPASPQRGQGMTVRIDALLPADAAVGPVTGRWPWSVTVLWAL